MLKDAEFVACKPCWQTHSGVEPTEEDGKLFRPFAQYQRIYRECHFCGQTTMGVFAYKEVEE